MSQMSHQTCKINEARLWALLLSIANLMANGTLQVVPADSGKAKAN